MASCKTCVCFYCSDEFRPAELTTAHEQIADLQDCISALEEQLQEREMEIENLGNELESLTDNTCGRGSCGKAN